MNLIPEGCLFLVCEDLDGVAKEGLELLIILPEGCLFLACEDLDVVAEEGWELFIMLPEGCLFLVCEDLDGVAEEAWELFASSFSYSTFLASILKYWNYWTVSLGSFWDLKEWDNER